MYNLTFAILGSLVLLLPQLAAKKSGWSTFSVIDRSCVQIPSEDFSEEASPFQMFTVCLPLNPSMMDP